ncbi:MAG: hypothetical protein ACREDS_11965 [Limisphaerales bacterium]
MPLTPRKRALRPRCCIGITEADDPQRCGKMVQHPAPGRCEKRHSTGRRFAQRSALTVAMSQTKAKQLRAFNQLPDSGDAKLWAITVASDLHRQALTLLMVFEGAAYWKFNQSGLTKSQRKDAEIQYKIAVGNFRQRLLDAYDKKDGSFFHALADVIETGVENSRDWNDLERFIYRYCFAAQEMKKPLPYPSELLSAWDKFRSGKKTFPANIQIKQIISTAKNFGFNLPRMRKPKKSE